MPAVTADTLTLPRIAPPTLWVNLMNTKAELIEALEDFNAGRFGQIPPNALMPHRLAR